MPKHLFIYMFLWITWDLMECSKRLDVEKPMGKDRRKPVGK
jgi:hypothetical protein